MFCRSIKNTFVHCALIDFQYKSATYSKISFIGRVEGKYGLI